MSVMRPLGSCQKRVSQSSCELSHPSHYVTLIVEPLPERGDSNSKRTIVQLQTTVPVTTSVPLAPPSCRR
ncbi:hypothetical protein OEZ86_007654 [Tetradesmus obliquus]|nr:hypothetical protein OEZ86_007654 [Tetradesmus obliquus]